jgi:beta-fructofuranosidase
VLKLDDCWIWDSWFVFDGNQHHVFFLKAPRSLGDPELRHRNPAIGHAVSADLINWVQLPDAISPSTEPGFDSWTTWTGSVIQADDGTWWMFYTGTSKEDSGDVQRIGAATSTDLINWQKLAVNPLTEADPTWYEKLDYQLWHDEAWRDPWVFKYQNQWQMISTARALSGEKFSRGVAGHAISDDLTNWKIMPPLTTTNSGFGQLEVIQICEIDSIPTMIWCCGPAELSAELRSKYPAGGVFSTTGETMLGPFDPTKAIWFPDPQLYAARAVKHGADWFLIGFINGTNDQFGYLTDPIPITVTKAGVEPK